MCIRDRTSAFGCNAEQRPNSELDEAATEYRSNRVVPALMDNSKIASGVRTWNCAGPRVTQNRSQKLLGDTFCA
eukprot:2385999-Alexandrium_andersonii.AAC.1